jgi:hypothetical protein
VPGFALMVFAGSATFPGGARTGCVTVSAVNADKVPMAPGFGQQPRFIVTIQPVGTTFNPPAPITMPNVDGLVPGQVTELYSYDHDLAAFVAIGTGTVTADGLLIRSDPGVGILKAGWHCGGDPNATGSAGTCPECKRCQGNTCIADPAQNGASCTTPATAEGVCRNGNCLPLEVMILSTDVRIDQIQLQVGPAGQLGTLVLSLLGSLNHEIRHATRLGGTLSETFDIPSLPQGLFTSIEATWIVGSRSVSNALAYRMKVHDNVRHSVYNTPNESECTASGSSPVYLTDNGCNFVQGTLNTQFKNQVDLNGSGVSNAHGALQVEAFCLSHANAPPDAAGRSYRRVTTITPACGTFVSDATVASYGANSGGPLPCSEEMYIYSAASPVTKEVTDNCPACGPVTDFVRQLDNYTTRPACQPSAFTDLGTFKTIQVF